MITSEVRIPIIIIRCRPCLTPVNQDIIVEEMDITLILLICLDVRDLLLVITQMDMALHTQVLHLHTTVVHHHSRTTARNRTLTRTRFALQEVKGHTNLILPLDRGKSERLRDFMKAPRISLFPCRILSEGQTVVQAIPQPQLARLLISLWQSHRISARDLLHTICRRCLVQRTFLTKVTDQLLKERILEIPQHQV